MTSLLSAGILLHRRAHDKSGPSEPEVWIAHMGGPFWAKKETAAWSIPKGEYDEGEDPLAVALREFEEEIGVPAPALDYRMLGEFRQRSGKVVTAFVAEFDSDLEWVSSNDFDVEWPPRSGRMASFPEVDRAEWCGLEVARARLVAGQVPILDALERRLG